jgi:putative NIF3 family GTP cyclohydrolase 1 type 2
VNNAELTNSSRRAFLLAGAALSLAKTITAQSTSSVGGKLTAGMVIDRIKVNIGIPWRQQTVDNLIAGSPDTLVKGIATTMMATLDVCKRANAAGKNMVISHESTFFSHQDTIDRLGQDATYLCKRDFLNQNGMAVFHFHDHWHGRHSDGIAAGMVRELGWEKNTEPDNLKVLNFPGTPLATFAQQIEAKLGVRTMRVLGDPNLRVNRVITSWGYVGAGIPLISREDIDVLVCGETREWELVEYVQDMISCGKKKGMIVVGHVVSEQAGMKLCAEWLKPLVPEVPIEFIAAAEPFWRPDAPVGLSNS